jgi:HEAT repeat protein
MPAWLLSDWVLWVLTVLCGLIGFTLAVRGLIGDRARGRPTCWKCRYDLSASPATASATATATACPECGHCHKKRKQLFKTRRYWFRFLFGATLFMIALYCHTGPEVQRRRGELGEKWWESVVPTTGWIVMLPKLKPDHLDLLTKRLRQPMNDGTGGMVTLAQDTVGLAGRSDPPESLPMLAPWQTSLLVSSCVRMMEDPATTSNDRLRCIHWVADAASKSEAGARVLLSLLDDEDDDIRAIANGALCRSVMNRTEVAAIMIDRLSHTTSHARRDAIGSLSRLGPDAGAAVPALARIMREGNRYTEQLGDALVAIGETAVPALMEMMRDRDHPARVHAIECIGNMKENGRAAWPLLLELMKDENLTVWNAALHSTTQLQRTIVPFLTAVAADQKSPHRLESIRALGALGADAEEALPTLLPIALSAQVVPWRQNELSTQACGAIDAIGVPPGTTKTFSRETWVNLLKALHSPSRVLRTFAWSVLVDADNAALPWIELAINESLIEIDQGIVRLVMQYNEKAKHLSPILVERMLRDPETFRSEIVDMLVHLGGLHPQVFPQIIAALDHEDARVRQLAEEVLASTPMDVGALLPILRKRIELPHASRRVSAIFLLGRMGPPAAPALQMLRRLAAGSDDETKAAAAAAILAIENAAGAAKGE